jgi:biotin carboxyl carrier protein
MRRYVISINDVTHTVDIEEVGNDTFTVQLGDGRLVTACLLDDHDLNQAQITPQVGGTPAARDIGMPMPLPSPTAVPNVPRVVPARSPVPRLPADPSPSAPRPAAGGPMAFEAPMPGVVLSVEVAPGTPVRRGQTLLVLEAMKMKNELKAPRDAIVARVLVKAGDQVKHGDRLIDFESVN